MAYVAVCVVAFVASGMTFFSGFGLGSILLPVFAVFFPMPAAVASTAAVHLSNNLFKLGLVGRHADRGVALRFGLPAVLAALAGALALDLVAGLPAVATWTLLSRTCVVTPVKLVIAALMAGFALFEMVPRLAKIEVDRRYLPIGGAMSGFFGGLSGHQGALRAAFLARCGLTPQAFVATGVVIACVVDVGRLAVYAPAIVRDAAFARSWPFVVSGTLAAFAGAFLGARLLKKTTMRFIHFAVGELMLATAIAVGAGIA